MAGRLPEGSRRRSALACLVAIGALLVGGAPGARAAPSPRRPNVLLIVTDDQRASGTLRVMPRTRRVFVRGGVRYPHAFATTPLCCPSRASIFSGRYAHNHGVLVNADAPELGEWATVQRYLRDAGYVNGLFGKYLNHWDISKSPPFFDTWSIFKGSRSHYYGGQWNEDGIVRVVDRYSTKYIAQRGARFVAGAEASDRRPWFLVLTPGAPHLPAIPHPDYASAPVPPWRATPATKEEDRSDKPRWVRSAEPRPRIVRAKRRAQLRSLMSVDDLVKRIFAKLAKHREKRRTLAIFMSDNGFLWGEHGLGGGTARKRSPYTDSVRIPLLARWPGHLPRGEVDGSLVANIDVAPTILRAAGLALDRSPPLDGRPLTSTRSRTRLLLEYWSDGAQVPEWASIRTLSYQYIESYAEDHSTVTFAEHYDQRRDPWQLDNALADGDTANDPDLEALSRRLFELRRCRGASCP
jgi:arylsulfatase A-like enzyme